MKTLNPKLWDAVEKLNKHNIKIRKRKGKYAEDLVFDVKKIDTRIKVR